MAGAKAGVCEFCGQTFSKRGIKRHLDACRQRFFDPEGNNRYYTLLIEGSRMNMYWLYVEVPSKLKLATLDDFLRGIWLECCGHLSQFTINGVNYASEGVDRLWGEESMNIALAEVVDLGSKFTYVYDFGSSTYLDLKVVSVHSGKSVEKIQLLARNNPPLISCYLCEEQAEWIDPEEFAWLCANCIEEEDEDWLLPVVNSPRTGVCGYDGS